MAIVKAGLAVLVAAGGLACGGGNGDRPDAAPAGAVGPATRTEPPPKPARRPVEPPLFPPATRSLRLTKTVAVRLEPGDTARQIGTIAQDTRVRWNGLDTGPGCKRPWANIEPRGWVCADFLEPLQRAPAGVELPRLERGELVPGVYGKVTAAGAMTYVVVGAEPKLPAPAGAGSGAGSGSAAPGPVTTPGEVDPTAPPAPAIPIVDAKRVAPNKPLVGSVNVRRYGELLATGGKRYWKISKSPAEYVQASVIRPHTPSDYGGVRLGDETGWSLPIGFVLPKGGGRLVRTYATPKKTGAMRQLPVRSAVRILDTATDPKGRPTGYRIGEAEWIDVKAVRRVDAATPPAALLRPTERWIDVDADKQVLVAYEGDLPVYATLVSTGILSTPTDPGVYRIWRKVMETDMRDLQSEDPYSVATVPWTQFFYPDDGLALHAAYWHDKFGSARSHGCVNLAPLDARWLYFWSDPWVPPGWTMTAGVVEAPGSVVRIRTAAVPDPPLRGYAKRVWEENQGRAVTP